MTRDFRGENEILFAAEHTQEGRMKAKLGRTGMRWWKLSSMGLTLAVLLGAMGCKGGNSSTGVAIAIAPVTASVITNRTQQFSSQVTGDSNTTVTWTVTCPTGVTAPACGTIDSNGLYTAPSVVPTVTTNGTTTVTPTATITATAAADSTKTATATLTIISGISISITPNAATVGTGETFSQFVATVNNPGCVLASNPTCQNVTWSLPTVTTAGTDGTIDVNTGLYTAPATAPSPNSITVTATSVADTAVTATATITVVTSIPPTVTSVSPNVMGMGGLFQDTYIAGTNFISTNRVYVNGVALPNSLVSDVSSSLIRIRIPDTMLAAPSVPPALPVLQVSVSQQTGAQQTCANPTDCQITVKSVRPGLVGPSPDSLSQSSSGVFDFNVDGGFFGTSLFPTVSATFNGQLRAISPPSNNIPNNARQKTITVGGSDVATPGLYPVRIQSAFDATKFAVANVAVQPNYNISSITTINAQLPVGTSPSDVAINPATGLAVVANRDSNDVSLIDLTAATPSVVATICTAAVGAVAPCPASGPISVSVDYVRNIALVVNAGSKTVAIVDLNSKAVSFVTPALQDSPGAVGINPVTGRALVAMQTRNYGILMDVTQSPPAFVGTVTISTGANTRVAVEPHLNWAMATPGGLGSIGIVDLNSQTVNQITNLSRTSTGTATGATNVVTVTVQPSTSTSPQPPLTVQVGDVVQIQGSVVNGTADPSFDGFFTVNGLGPGISQFTYTETTSATLPDVTNSPATGTINYAQPVATVGLTPTIQGIGINTETQQAVLVDPSAGGIVSFFSLIDQSVGQLILTTNNSVEFGMTAAAFNPLTNTAVVVNPFTNTLSVIDPARPVRLNDGNLYNTRPTPVAVAVDPGTNIAVVANQSDNSVSIISLGAIRPFSITETSPKTFVANSTLTSAPSPAPQQLTVLGNGFSTNSVVQLDGIALPTTLVSNRKLTATVPTTLLSSARRFSVQVEDSGAITNASDFTVEQSVDVTACSATPLPSGVAIDPQANLAAVSLEGCNSLALIDLATATGAAVQVGSNPVGVAVLPRLHTAVVSNYGSGTASVVDELSQTVLQTITTGAGSIGVAADQDTGQAAVANNVANTVTVLNVITAGTSTLSVGQSPVAVAFNNQNHQVAAAAAGADSLGFGTAGGTSLNASFSVSAPTAVVYDPVPSDCGTSNTLGCFIVSSSTTNTVHIIDPITGSQTVFRVGINPTAIAYNYLTSTLVSTNTLSHTITVSDLLARRIRAVLTLPPAPVNLSLTATGLPQFALDIHPLTNLAVIADTANGRVLFVPIPR
jgi:DNA-binding beta-propeller fold protein YncE